MYVKLCQIFGNIYIQLSVNNYPLILVGLPRFVAYNPILPFQKKWQSDKQTNGGQNDCSPSKIGSKKNDGGVSGISWADNGSWISLGKVVHVLYTFDLQSANDLMDTLTYESQDQVQLSSFSSGIRASLCGLNTFPRFMSL